MEDDIMNDMIACMGSLIGYSSDDDEEELLSQMKHRMMTLEGHYIGDDNGNGVSDFNRLSIVKKLRSFLANKIFDANDKTSVHSHANHVHALEAARRDVVQHIRIKSIQLSDSDCMLTNMMASSSSSSSSSSAAKKQKKGHFELFDFDDLPPYEPLEVILVALRVDCLNEHAIVKLLDMDALELAEHHQWEELVALLHKGLSMASSLDKNDTASTSTIAIKMIQIHIKFFCAFSGQQSVDMASNVIRYLWDEWSISIACKSSSSSSPSSSSSSSLQAASAYSMTLLQRLQLAAFALILTWIPDHFLVCSDKVVDKTVGSLFLLLAKGTVVTVVTVDSSTGGGKSITPVLDCLMKTADMGRFVSRYITAFPSLQVTALSLQAGLVDELGRRVVSYDHSVDFKSSKQSTLTRVDSMLFPFVVNLRMWLVLLSPLINTTRIGSESLNSNRNGDVAAGLLWDASQHLSSIPDVEMVADTNKKFTKISRSFSVIEVLVAEAKGSPPLSPLSPLPLQCAGLLRAFKMYAELLVMKSESFKYPEAERHEKASDITQLSCDVMSLFVAHSTGLDTASCIAFFEALHQLLSCLEQLSDTSIPSLQMQWSVEILLAVCMALDHFVCTNTTTTTHTNGKLHDKRVASSYLLCLKSATESALRLTSLCSPSTEAYEASLSLTLTVIRVWIRVMSGLSVVCNYEQELQTLVPPLVKTLNVCSNCLKDAVISDESSDDHLHDSKRKIRISALELIVLVVSNHQFSIGSPELAHIFKDALGTLLTSIAMPVFDDDMDLWERAKGSAVLNICSNRNSGPMLSSLLVFEKVLVDDLSNPLTLETLVTDGQVSDSLKPLFSLLDGLCLLGHVDAILLLLTKATYSLDKLLSSENSAKSISSFDKASVRLIAASGSINWESDDFGKVVHGLLDISMLNINYCLNTRIFMDGLMSSDSDSDSDRVQDHRNCFSDNISSLSTRHGSDLSLEEKTDSSSSMTDLTREMLDDTEWSKVPLVCLLQYSYNLLDSSLWSLDVTAISRGQGLSVESSSLVVSKASEMIFEALCCQRNALTETCQGWHKLTFLQLVIACDSWSKSVNFTDCSSDEFNWFIGACSLAWLPQTSSETNALPYVLQFVHSSPQWNEFFKDGLLLTTSHICRLLSKSCGQCVVSFFNNRGLPVAVLIKSMIRQWFFKYLSVQDIQRLTVLCVLQGPDIVVCTITSILHHFVDYLHSSTTGHRERALISFKAFMSTCNISLLTLAPQINNYINNINNINKQNIK